MIWLIIISFYYLNNVELKIEELEKKNPHFKIIISI